MLLLARICRTNYEKIKHYCIKNCIQSHKMANKNKTNSEFVRKSLAMVHVGLDDKSIMIIIAH